LVHPSGHQLVMVISDCRSSLWQRGPSEEPTDGANLYSWLHYWASYGPTVLVQLLPEWLWERSTLSLGVEAQFQAFTPGQPNSQLVVHGVSRRNQERLGLAADRQAGRSPIDTSNILKLPVITLDASSVLPYALVVAGAGSVRAPGVVLNLAKIQTQLEQQQSVDQLTDDSSPEAKAVALVDTFLAAASMTAQELAGMMAAAPVSLSVVHLLQANLLQNSTPVHVAEVYMSGLLEQQGLDENGQPIYEFKPHVRSLLNQAMPRYTTERVIEVLSQAIADKLDITIGSFAAFLSPKQEWLVKDRRVARFAEILPDILRNLGEDYAAFIDQVEQNKLLTSSANRTSITPRSNSPALDLLKFYQLTDPSKTLDCSQPADKKYYIDFSSVRGGHIIAKLRQKISLLTPNRPTCTLFTGHIGCGKSTELLRLKADLEGDGFHVVYFVSSKNLELADVDVGDLLLAIAQSISQSLDSLQVKEPTKLKTILLAAAKLLNTEIELGLPLHGVGEIAINQEGLSLVATGIGKITARAKNDGRLRDKLNQFLAPQKIQLLGAINGELIKPAIEALKAQGKKGLVVIIDNLDRISNTPKYGNRSQQEYLFIDQGEFLNSLDCHIVYTMPLSLKFYEGYYVLAKLFDPPDVLPIVAVQYADGQDCEDGLQLLEQMVLARAYPDLSESDRVQQSAEIFDHPDSLRRLCQISGGHVGNLLRLLNSWIQEEMALPLSRESLEAVIRSFRNEMVMQVSDSEWALLKQVMEHKHVTGDQQYWGLIRSRLVFEYRANGQSWFDVNPTLKEAPELQR
jgi:hypothetical protein